MNNKLIGAKSLSLGVCYYPEHWEKSLWQDDLRRMKELGITTIRIAEFAWNFFEPAEGVFSFEFFDAFMDIAQSENMQVIFCTPTATAPAWMSKKYPEILNADIDGNLCRHGGRRQNNLTSPKYLEFCSRITRMLAEHYGQHPSIIGWQLDNEINCEIDFYRSESDHIAFREYLKNKYISLDTLNEKMGTVFWNQTYTSWDELYLTRRTNQPGHANPHMMLEEKRFISNSVIHFFKLQSDILRKYIGDRFITTNGLFGHIDYHQLIGTIFDFIMYDNYPNFSYEMSRNPNSGNGLRDRNSSFNLTRVRSISPVFGIMEQQSGGGGWNFCMTQPMPKPGQLRLWSMQALAHGADFISYFRWRTCTVGTEIYWFGLNDYSNLPNRRLSEVQQVYEDIKKLSEIAGTQYLAKVAILKDYDNEFDGEEDLWHGPLTNQSTDGWFCALQKAHIPFDFVYITDDTNSNELSRYDYIIYPHAAILTKARADMLAECAETSIVIFGCRTGYKDIYGRCPMMPMPGYAADLCGCTVAEYTLIGPYDTPSTFTWDGDSASGILFNDVLSPTTGDVIGTFDTNHYAGKPALIRNGNVYYFGSVFSEDTANLFIQKLSIPSPAAEYAVIPPSIEAAIRGHYLILLNYDAQDIEFTLKSSMYDALGCCDCSGICIIPPYGVRVFKIN